MWYSPVSVIVSPSSRNFLVKFSSNCKGFDPRHDNSSIDPNESDVGPLIVPVAIKSPGLKLQPVIVWWTNICFKLQYMNYEQDKDKVKNWFAVFTFKFDWHIVYSFDDPFAEEEEEEENVRKEEGKSSLRFNRTCKSMLKAVGCCWAK